MLGAAATLRKKLSTYRTTASRSPFLLRAAGFHVDLDGAAQLSSGPLLGSVRFGHVAKGSAT